MADRRRTSNNGSSRNYNDSPRRNSYARSSGNSRSSSYDDYDYRDDYSGNSERGGRNYDNDYDGDYSGRSPRRSGSDDEEAGDEPRGVSLGNVLLSIVLIALLVGMYFLLHSSLFNISEISVIGCGRFSSAEIISASGIDYSVNFLAVDKEAAKAEIEKNPYIRVDKIRHVFPTGIEIYVTERTATAQIFTVNGYYIIDGDCVALTLNSAKDETLISVTNMGIAKPTFGETVVSDDSEKVEGAINVLNAINDYALFEVITEVNMDNPERIVLTYENRFYVVLAEGTTAALKLSRLESIVEQSADKIKDGCFVNLETEGGYYISYGD